MATAPDKPTRTVADVDALIDENGSRIEVPEDSEIKVAGEHDATIGATGPTNWWLYGLGALAIIIAIVLLMQVISGAPGSDVQPGSPVAAPVVEPAVPAN
ncbi:MAG: hypothetical protein ACOH2L_18400 [Devosia sp.]